MSAVLLLSEHRFRDAAGHAEDHACAGHRAKRHIYGFRVNIAEHDAGFLDHAHKLLGGKHIVHILLAVHFELIAHRFKLLRRARHNRHMYALAAGIATVFPNHGSKHLHGRFAC